MSDLFRVTPRAGNPITRVYSYTFIPAAAISACQVAGVAQPSTKAHLAELPLLLTAAAQVPALLAGPCPFCRTACV